MNDWLTYNTKIKAATKDNLVAVVYEDSATAKAMRRTTWETRKTAESAADNLKIAGAEYRAIPTKYLNPFGTVIHAN